MSIYRGAGGSGDAVSDSSSEASLVQQLAIEAQSSATAAASSASSASTSATNAANSAASIDTALFARKANNLSDLASVSTARTNLGLVASATTDTTNATNIASGTLPAARLPAFTGDATATAGTSALTLATVNSTTGSFGSASSIPVVTVNGKGLVTSVTTATVAGGQYFGTAASKAIAYNEDSIAENITTTSGKNCLSVGPITISSGFSVTIASGQRWIIL